MNVTVGKRTSFPGDDYMNLKKLFTLLCVSMLPLLGGGSDTRPSDSSAWCENFDRGGKNNMPTGWKFEGAKWGVPKTLCQIKDSLLVVTSNRATGGIIISPKVDLNKTPVMRWRWRVRKYPTDADGRDPKRDDQAVAIYVGMSGGMVSKKSIAYRWETVTPVEFEGSAVYGGGIVEVHYIVMRNQNTPAGEWVTETRNIAEDLKRIYGKIPTEFAISVCGNSQYTKSNTIAEVDFIEFLPAESK